MTNILGRQAVGVEQPPFSGNTYPFISPSDDVRDLITDFYLITDDRLNRFSFPFRIAALFNFGSIANPNKPLGIPYGYGLRIVDANDVKVFDSRTDGPSRDVMAWPAVNPRLDVVEWITASLVCRIVVHTSWTDIAVSEAAVRAYSDYIEPGDARLIGRTTAKAPYSVTSLVVGNVPIRGPIEFATGYNMQLSAVVDELVTSDTLSLDDIDADSTAVSRKTLIEGKRVVRGFEMAAVAGTGLGVVPGCQEAVPVIRRIGGVGPDESGNINIDAGNCLKVNRPLELFDAEPRQAIYSHPELVEEEARSSLVFGNDCKPCNDCDYYVRVYKGLKRQWNRWKEQSLATQVVRDSHKENVDRWAAAKACRESDPLKVVLLAQVSCNAAVGAVFCNTSPCCLTPITLRFTFEAYSGGALTVSSVVTCGGFEVQGVETDGYAPGVKAGYAIEGAFPVLDLTLPYLQPQESARVTFAVCASDCTSQDSLKVTVSAHYPALSLNSAGVECVSPAMAVPSNLSEIWAANNKDDSNLRAVKASSLIPLNTLSAYCSQCTCLPSNL